MYLYRVAANDYGFDLSGEGARLYGGRWNKPGRPMVYCSETIALATLEILTYIPPNLLKKHFTAMRILVESTHTIQEKRIEQLPEDWHTYPAPAVLAEMGNEFLIQNESLMLKVPSAVVPCEYNYLINPLHKDINKVYVEATWDFSLDHRIWQQVHKVVHE